MADSMNHIPSTSGIRAAVELLLASEQPAFVVGDDVAAVGAVSEVVRLAESTGAQVWWENLRTYSSFPNHHPSAKGSLPLDAEGMRRTLQAADLVVLLGGAVCDEVWYSEGTRFPNGARVLQIAESEPPPSLHPAPNLVLRGSLLPSLQLLLDDLQSSADGHFAEAAAMRNAKLAREKEAEHDQLRSRVERLAGRWPLPPVLALSALQATMPKNGIVVDESVSANAELGRLLQFTATDDYFGGRGGGIGQGLAGALGVQLAYPDRSVVAVSGDGSAMYSIQSLWTAARYGLPVVFMILANGEYRVLKHNLDTYRQRFAASVNGASTDLNLSNPPLSFVDLAHGMGVAASRPSSYLELVETLQRAFQGRQPYLVEVSTEGKI